MQYDPLSDVHFDYVNLGNEKKLAFTFNLTQNLHEISVFLRKVKLKFSCRKIKFSPSQWVMLNLTLS